MSLNHSPSIVTNGLIFAYDMANTKKSWKGPPATNLLAYSDSLNGGLWSGYCGGTSNVTYKTTDIFAPDGSYNATKLVMDGSTGCGAGASWGLLYGQSAIFTSGQTYTVSIWAKCAAGTMTMTLGMNDSFGTGITLTTDWQRFSYTATITSNLDRGLQFIRGDSTNGRTFYVWCAQCEQNSFATPYVAGTRYANNNLESTPNYPTWNQAASSASGGTLTFTAGSYNSKANWDLYKTYSGLSTGTNYTWSALVKLGTATNLLVTMNNASAWNTGPSAQFNLGQLSTSEFRRVSITGTTNTGSFNLHLGASANSELAATVQSGGTVFLQDVRLVLTGSQTALVDLTDNNTWTVNNLTYNSDGTFSFNGSNSYVSSPTSSLFDTQVVTMESWCYPTVTAQNGFLFEKGNVNTQYSNFFNGDGTFYFRTMGVSSQDLTFASASYITANKWNHIVCTYGNGTKTIYVNGVQIAQATGITGYLPTGQNGQWVGIYGSATGYPFSGKIGVSKVYNRALSAAEVLQNFNALRGRYGI